MTNSAAATVFASTVSDFDIIKRQYSAANSPAIYWFVTPASWYVLYRKLLATIQPYKELCPYLGCDLCVRICHVLSSVFTAEQYQQHQEQLALMQKHQLEQIQQQQQANNIASTPNTQVRKDGERLGPWCFSQNLLYNRREVLKVAMQLGSGQTESGQRVLLVCWFVLEI